MQPGFENHFCGPCQHGGGVVIGFFSGQTAGHGSVGQSFHEHIGIGGAAAGDGAGGVNESFVQCVHGSAGCHVGQPVCKGFFVHQVVFAILSQPLAHSNGGVGVDADYGKGMVRGILQRFQYHTGADGNEKGFSFKKDIVELF